MISEGPSRLGDNGARVDWAKLALAAEREVNDTGNAERFLLWHGDDFININVSEGAGASFGSHCWHDTHWEAKEAQHVVKLMAQKVPPLIQLEAELIKPNERELACMLAGETAAEALLGAKRELTEPEGDSCPSPEGTDLLKIGGV